MVPTDRLKHLYHTGEGADISIGTKTRTFQVHRLVVCTRSAFFSAAFIDKSNGAKRQHVDLEEGEEFICNLLRHLYELEVPILSAASFDTMFTKDSLEALIGKPLHLQLAAENVHHTYAT